MGNLLKAYEGHANSEYCLELCLQYLPNLRGGRNILMTGSEDGRLVGWDMNSQKVILNKPREVVPADSKSKKKKPQSPASNPSASAKTNRHLVSSLDYQTSCDLIATCGPGVSGLKIHKLTPMIESGL